MSWSERIENTKAKSPSFHRGFSGRCAGAIRSMYHEVWAGIRVPLAA
jgi:hypothetical protein